MSAAFTSSIIPIQPATEVSFNKPITDKIIIHANGYVNCYIWETGNSEYDKKQNE